MVVKKFLYLLFFYLLLLKLLYNGFIDLGELKSQFTKGCFMNTMFLKANHYASDFIGLKFILKNLLASRKVEDQFEEVGFYDFSRNTLKHEIDFTEVNENSLSSKSVSGNSMVEVPALLRPKSLEENLEMLHEKLEDSKKLDLLIHELQAQAELFEHDIKHLDKTDKMETLMLPKQWQAVLEKRVEEHSQDLAIAENDYLVAQQRLSEAQSSLNELSNEYNEVKYGLEQNAIFISQQEPLYMQTLVVYERAQEMLVHAFIEDQGAEGAEECSLSVSRFSQEDEVTMACERMNQAEAIILEATQVLEQLEMRLQEVELRMNGCREEHELAQVGFDQKLARYIEMQNLFNEHYHNYRDSESHSVDEGIDTESLVAAFYDIESDVRLDKVGNDFVAA